MDSLSIAGLGAEQERFTVSQAQAAQAKASDSHHTALAGIQLWFLNASGLWHGTLMRIYRRQADRVQKRRHGGN
jgi:hypothetical protein